jgi:hypothetical protein
MSMIGRREDQDRSMPRDIISSNQEPGERGQDSVPGVWAYCQLKCDSLKGKGYGIRREWRFTVYGRVEAVCKRDRRSEPKVTSQLRRHRQSKSFLLGKRRSVGRRIRWRAGRRPGKEGTPETKGHVTSATQPKSRELPRDPPEMIIKENDNAEGKRGGDGRLPSTQQFL